MTGTKRRRSAKATPCSLSMKRCDTSRTTAMVRWISQLLLLVAVRSAHGFAPFPSIFTPTFRIDCCNSASSRRMIRESDNFGPIDDETPSIESLGPEVITPPEGGEDEYGDTEADWLPDIEKARMMKEYNMARAESDIDDLPKQPKKKKATPVTDLGDDDGTSNVDDYFTPLQKQKRQIYTEEEEDLINRMGGKSKAQREPGFLGDSSLKEIAADFQIPMCYLADVLCTWGVPVPINVDERLGDMVTGEMAFALAEAVHSMDVGEIYDSYSSFDLDGLCYEYSIELKDAFDFCIKEQWNLPFGVKTHLRIDQEDKLVRALSDDLMY